MHGQARYAEPDDEQVRTGNRAMKLFFQGPRKDQADRGKQGRPCSASGQRLGQDSETQQAGNRNKREAVQQAGQSGPETAQLQKHRADQKRGNSRQQ